MTKEIENFKLKTFLVQKPELIKQYVLALQYLTPLETERPVFEMKLKHVEFIKQSLFSNEDSALIEIISKVQKIKVKDVLNMRIIKFFRLVASVKIQLTQIVNAESNALASGEDNYKWIAVDGDAKMSKFGIYNTLEKLANGDILKYKAILNLKYSDVFTTLYMKKTAKELRVEMDAIKTPTKKR